MANLNHAHYHPNCKTLHPERFSQKKNFGIDVSISCSKCKTTLHRRIDSVEHFDEILVRRGWKKVEYDKPAEDDDTSFSSVHGMCCGDCVTAINTHISEFDEKQKKSPSSPVTTEK